MWAALHRARAPMQRRHFSLACILSAGIFRGACPLKVVIEKGLETIAKNTYPGLETVVFCGFTPQEQAELSDFAASVA